MYSTSTAGHRIMSDRYGAHTAAPAWLAQEQCAPGQASDSGFVELLNAYRQSGGLARADEVNHLLERHLGLDAATLAHWIAQRRVIGFEWLSQTWLPQFQFALPGPLPAPQVTAVLAELSPVFNAWETAQWFVQPNIALGHRPPLTMMADDAIEVMHVARGDRDIATR